MTSRRVIFPAPDFWTNPTHKRRTSVSDKPAPVNRHLTDAERTLLNQLTIWCLAEQTGVSDTEAQRALSKLNEESGLDIAGDAYDVYVKTREHGHVIVHCTREWLDFHAHSGEQLTSEELRRTLNRGKEHG